MVWNAVVLHGGAQLQETRSVHPSGGPLTKIQKMWNSRCIAIEDPFELHHNIGIVVPQKMHIYIMNGFIKERSLFRTPTDKLPASYSTHADYFFDSRQLTDGQRPSDRVSVVQQDWPPRQGVPATAGSRH
ncbi:hypothetical protein HPB48_011941 [Haemaphysalis longicornis]|uniref:Uncharacterized protein n=1 Tax=Haemaphysalis longicornis TaxID=44386 RepID=A0A9J6GTH3_HAELO|nr:hypothetical protein HPB48_011941 [Haemaphysalis longicornis]